MSVSEQAGTQSRPRNEAIELLRIAAMLLIVTGHLIGHNDLLNRLPAGSLNYYLVSLLQVLCYPATNIYVLISGYLLCEKRFKVRRVFTLWAQVWIYSVLGFLFGAVLLRQVSLSGLLKSVLPISGKIYWFATVYFGLYLLMPFLNLLIDRMDRKQHRYCLLILTLLFSLWRSFIPFAATLNPEGGNSILWFFVLYLYGAYLRRYGLSKPWIRKYRWPLALGLLFAAFLSRHVIGYLSGALGFGGKGTSLFTEFTAFPMLFSAVLIVSWAVERQPKKLLTLVSPSMIRFFSASTFSVYLIHENPYLKQWLYPAMDAQFAANLPAAIPIVLGLSVMLLIGCTLIDHAVFCPLRRLLDRLTIFDRAQAAVDAMLYAGE